MATQGKYFPYEKNIVINALYDIIEELGLSLDSSNSSRGTLIVSDREHTGKMRIALSFVANTTQTRVEVYPEPSNASFAETWTPVVLCELGGRMEWVHKFRRGETTK